MDKIYAGDKKLIVSDQFLELKTADQKLIPKIIEVYAAYRQEKIS